MPPHPHPQGIVYSGTVPQEATQRFLAPTRAGPLGGRPRPAFVNSAFANVLDYGADPTGAADCSAAFAAAMAAVPTGAFGRVTVPPGTSKLNSVLNAPSGRTIAFDFQDGAAITGSGGLGVARVESVQGPPRKYYIITETGAGFLESLNKAWGDLNFSVIQATKSDNK